MPSSAPVSHIRIRNGNVNVTRNSVDGGGWSVSGDVLQHSTGPCTFAAQDPGQQQWNEGGKPFYFLTASQLP